MRKFRFAVALSLFSGFAFTQLVFGQSAPRIDAAAIWQVTPAVSRCGSRRLREENRRQQWRLPHRPNGEGRCSPAAVTLLAPSTSKVTGTSE